MLSADLVFVLGLHHQVTAISRATGKTVWMATTGSTSKVFGTNAALAGGNLVAADNDLYAFNAATGSPTWSFKAPPERPGLFPIASDGATIYAGSVTGVTYAIDGATGTIKWRAPVHLGDGVSVYAPYVKDGVVYVGMTGFTSEPTALDTGFVAAVDAATGAIRWVTPLPRDALVAPFSSSTVDVVETNGVVVATERSGGVYGHGRDNGRRCMA